MDCWNLKYKSAYNEKVELDQFATSDGRIANIIENDIPVTDNLDLNELDEENPPESEINLNVVKMTIDSDLKLWNYAQPVSRVMYRVD